MIFLHYIQKENMKNNIHILPSDRVTNLHIFENRFEYTISINSKSYQNLYITSDEKIKNGDWCYSIYGFVIRVDYISDGYIHHVGGGDNRTDCYKKIILTTDQKLINDDVQAIEDNFLEWFVKNPNFEEIGVEQLPLFKNPVYKTVIPKEEPNGCIGSNGVSDPKLNEVQLNQPKQLAVEWLQEQLNKILIYNQILQTLHLFEQAKQME